MSAIVADLIFVMQYNRIVFHKTPYFRILRVAKSRRVFYKTPFYRILCFFISPLQRKKFDFIPFSCVFL
jgi:hypothetical protein